MALTPAQRKAAAVAAAEARWGSKLPVATHTGILRIGELELPCFVLETGQRVLSRNGMVRALGMSKGGNLRNGGDRLTSFVAGDRIKPFVSEGLARVIGSPVRFRTNHGGSEAFGYDANALADICEAVLRYRASGAMQAQQQHLATQCEVLMRGFARVGITALVDEATGYQADRAKDALAKILEAFVAKELQPWVSTFPPDYYKELFRLRGWEFPPKENRTARPPLVGKLTNGIVYDRLAPGVRAELVRMVERDEHGRLKAKLHQGLNKDRGHPKLKEHLAVVVAMMKVSKDYPAFRRRLDVVAPKLGDTMSLDLD